MKFWFPHAKLLPLVFSLACFPYLTESHEKNTNIQLVMQTRNLEAIFH